MSKEFSEYCPGGTGKKIKHCMCRDIGNDLNKVMRALAGGQRVAAMNQINRLLATNAHRPCLLALKCLTLMEMNDMQNLDDVVATYVKAAPDNVLAHTFAAFLEVRKRNPKGAVDSLQTALGLVDEFLPGELYDAIGSVAEALARDSQYVAARGHLLFRAMIGREEEDNSFDLLAAITGARQIPLLLKRDFSFRGAPADVAWAQAFSKATDLSTRGAWKMALDAFEKLNEEYPGQAEILHNIATARSYLGYSGAAEAWHRYAMLESLDFDDAVIAEAVSQLLQYEATRKTVGIVKLTREVSDAEQLQERLLSSKQVVLDKRDLTPMAAEDSPPPKALYHLLDRPDLTAEGGAALEVIPRVLCQLLLYGKETDREARVEIILAKDQQFESTMQLVADVAAGLLMGDDWSEEVADTVPVESAELFPKLRFTDDMSVVDCRRLNVAAVQAAFAEKWPHLPMTVLDDKTPQQVVGDQAYRVRLTAALLVLEQMAEVHSWAVDVDDLREQLGVPRPSPIDPSGKVLERVKPHEFHLLEVEKLDDDQLVRTFSRANFFFAKRALKKLGAEILRREHLADRVDMAAAAGAMAQLEDDPELALQGFEAARRWAEKLNQSPARLYLEELPLCLMLGQPKQVEHIVTVLKTRHMSEPNVAQSLYNILVRFGIISPQGQAGQAAAADPAPVAAAPAPDGDPQIWTPDAPSKPPAGKQQESKLWVPGMD